MQCVNCKNEVPSLYNYNNLCQSTLPSTTTMTDTTYNIVVDCITASKRVYNGVCVDTCPSLTAIYSGGNECFAWTPLSKFMYNNLIVTSCPANLAPDSDNICVNCKNYTPEQVYYNGTCVATTPVPTTIIDTVYNVAVDCITASKKIYNGACFATCPSLTAIYSGGNECFAWKPISKFMYNNLIVTSCPVNLASDSDNICVNCKNYTPEQVYYNGACFATTPVPTTIIDTVYNVAVDCITLSKKIYNGACVATCPSLTAIYSGGNECFAWTSISKFMYNDLIVESCPQYLAPNSDNICINCKSYSPEQFYYDGKCYVSTPVPTLIINTTYNVAIDCASANKKIYNGSCVDSCVQDTATYKDGNECFNWKSISKYYYNNYVVDTCPDSNKYPDDKNICFNCDNQYYLDGKCADSCPSTYYINEFKECYTCAQVDKILYQGTCISICPEYTGFDQAAGTCIVCKDNGSYYLPSENKCVKSCPTDNPYIIESNLLCVKDCKDYNLVENSNMTCANNCNEGDFLTNSTNTCGGLTFRI